jgi:dienelactone hydrolase
MKFSRRRAIAAGIACVASPIATAFAGAYRDVAYQSGGLNIQAYFYRPAGAGSFPLVIYNHGSREHAEHKSVPWVKIAGLFVDAGYAVLIPERRGYGTSDGPTWSDAVGKDTGAAFIQRCNEEADDVIAAAAFAAQFPAVDHSRIGVVGWSLGGIVTMLAIARSTAFRAAIDQAGGALNWRRNPDLQAALEDAARAAKCPVMLMDSENDAAPEDIPSLADLMAKANLPHDSRMYPPYTPASNPGHMPPGHLIFEAAGIPIWGRDATTFLDAHVKP